MTVLKICKYPSIKLFTVQNEDHYKGVEELHFIDAGAPCQGCHTLFNLTDKLIFESLLFDFSRFVSMEHRAKIKMFPL